MDKCTKCGKEAEFVKNTFRCRECRRSYQLNWERKKKDRRCAYCKKEFIPTSVAKECSMRCRLLNKIEKENDCWIWKGKITNGGYGEITEKRKYMLAHRASYTEFKGDIPKGLCVCHSCDVKSCINPDHLWVGTQKENMEDSVKKGLRSKGGWTYTKPYYPRKTNRKGENHHLCKLKNDDVLKIKNRLKSGERYIEIANEYNVNPKTIYDIEVGKNWSHLKE